MRIGSLLVAALMLCGCPDPGPSKPPSLTVSVDVRPCFEGCPASRPPGAEFDACLVLSIAGATQRTRIALSPDSPSTETALRARRGSRVSGQLFVLTPGLPAGACDTLLPNSGCSADAGCHQALILDDAELESDAPLLFGDPNGGCERTWATPVNELCNGEDEDCDGRMDEGFPGLGEPCGRGIGACRREGFVVCDGLDGVACDAMEAEPAPVDDACALTDADCDGRFAEDAVRVCNQGLEAPCRPGTQHCIVGETPSWSPCFSEFGHPVPIPTDEVCDRRDNDCDGRADEDVDLMGDPAHCGSCGFECGADDPGARYLCEAGRCVLDACNEGYVDADGDPANGCECAPGAADLIDALALDSDCDGVADEDSGDAVIYVAADAPDGGDGSVGAPLNSLAAAFTAASAQGLAVALEVGLHDVTRGRTGEERAAGPLSLPDGVSLFGGFEQVEGRWGRRAAAVHGGDSVLTGAPVVLRVASPSRPVSLSGVALHAAQGAVAQWVDGERIDGSNSVALWAKDVDSHLTLSHVRLRASLGGGGADGLRGSAGAPGVDGGAPGDTLACQFPECGGVAGIGGAPCTPVVDHPSGGRGGNRGLAGEEGVGFRGIRGGWGGSPMVDRNGRNGAMGDHAPRTPRGEVHGHPDAILGWRPALGPPSETGIPGTGGGGGAGGEIYGGSGGGSGGCPAISSGSASAGYGSLALLIEGGQVRLQNVNLLPGRGGVGGQGGPALPGGVGGVGGGPGRREQVQCEGTCVNAPDFDACMPRCRAGIGGQGGQGGCGAPTAGGAGGPSFGILAVYPTSERGLDDRFLFIDDTGDALPDQEAAMIEATVVGLPGAGGRGGRGRGQCDGRDADDGLFGPGGLYGCCVPDQLGRCDDLLRCP